MREAKVALWGEWKTLLRGDTKKNCLSRRRTAYRVLDSAPTSLITLARSHSIAMLHNG